MFELLEHNCLNHRRSCFFYLPLSQLYPDNRVLKNFVTLAHEVMYLSLLKERPSRSHAFINANNKNNNDNISNNNIDTVKELIIIIIIIIVIVIVNFIIVVIIIIILSLSLLLASSASLKMLMLSNFVGL